jgi:hypothetical protein
MSTNKWQNAPLTWPAAKVPSTAVKVPVTSLAVAASPKLSIPGNPHLSASKVNLPVAKPPAVNLPKTVEHDTKNNAEVCKFFSRNGNCRNGASCKFAHASSSSTKLSSSALSLGDTQGVSCNLESYRSSNKAESLGTLIYQLLSSRAKESESDLAFRLRIVLARCLGINTSQAKTLVFGIQRNLGQEAKVVV